MFEKLVLLQKGKKGLFGNKPIVYALFLSLPGGLVVHDIEKRMPCTVSKTFFRSVPLPRRLGRKGQRAYPCPSDSSSISSSNLFTIVSG